jgi:hypothetical protein
MNKVKPFMKRIKVLYPLILFMRKLKNWRYILNFPIHILNISLSADTFSKDDDQLAYPPLFVFFSSSFHAAIFALSSGSGIVKEKWLKTNSHN